MAWQHAYTPTPEELARRAAYTIPEEGERRAGVGTPRPSGLTWWNVDGGGRTGAYRTATPEEAAAKHVAEKGKWLAPDAVIEVVPMAGGPTVTFRRTPDGVTAV